MASRDESDTPGEPENPWWIWLLYSFVFPTVLVFVIIPLGVIGVLSMPAGWAYSASLRSRERRFLQQMMEQGRFVEWNELEQKLLSGEGTLVVEQAQKQGCRVWWTAEDVAGLSPAAPPSEDELDYLKFTPAHPFVLWCFQQCLQPESGRAILTNPPYLYPPEFIDSYPPGFMEADFFRSRFPHVNVVMTVKQI